MLAGAVLAAATHSVAQASPPLQVALDYQVDPTLSDCPSTAELSAAIGKQLGYDPFVAGAAATKHHLKASIQRAGEGAEAHVEWLDERGSSEGERRLSSDRPGCAELARGLTFAIAVQIQLRASAETPPPSPPAIAPPPVAPKRPPPPAKKLRRRLVLVGAGAFAQHGLTPDISPGLRVFGSLGNELVSLEVSTQATLPSRFGSATLGQASPLVPHPSFTARELSAKLAPCVHHLVAGFCAVGMLGPLHVRGEGVDRVQSPSSLVAGVGARFQLLWPVVPAFGVRLQAEALVLLTPRTVVLNRQDMWSTAPVVLGAGLDLAAIFQ